MKVLLVAPEVCAPYTEGRKQYVLDVAQALTNRHQTYLSTTIRPGAEWPEQMSAWPPPNSKSGAGHLWQLQTSLCTGLRAFRPEALLHFPYGSFNGIRGFANDLSIRAVSSLAARQGIPAATVFYAVDANRSPEQLRKLHPLVTIVGNSAESFAPLNLAINDQGWPPPTPAADRPRRVLFMAGMWQPSRERLEHVLAVRGLGCFLQAGQHLAAAGIDGLVACPLFHDEELRRAALYHPANTWPEGRLMLRATVIKPNIFEECQLLIFPYQEQLLAFTPSSVAEAMLAATPVLLSDQDFLSPLAAYAPDLQVRFPAKHPEALANQAVALLADITRVASLAHIYAQKRWGIAALGKQLDELLNTISQRT